MRIAIGTRYVTVPILPIAAGLALVILLLSAVRIARIQPNEIGIFVNNMTGNITVEARAGAKPYVGWISSFFTLDGTEQNYVMSNHEQGSQPDAVRVKTADGADVTLDVAVSYRLAQDPEIIRSRVIPECGLEDRPSGREYRIDAWKATWVRDYARTVIRYKFGELTPNTFYSSQQREDKAREAQEELNRKLNPHGIEVTLVRPGVFNFYQELETMIDDKKAADQEALAQASKAEAARKEQETDMATATKQKEVAIARLQGDLQQRVLQVEAEAEKAVKAADAYSYGTKKEADAQLYKAKNDAQSILASAEAEAEGLSRLASALAGEGGTNLVRLAYVAALKGARIDGVPYATDPRIQKVEVSGTGLAPSTIPGALPAATVGSVASGNTRTTTANGGER